LIMEIKKKHSRIAEFIASYYNVKFLLTSCL
jgi:hypothetical protein